MSKPISDVREPTRPEAQYDDVLDLGQYVVVLINWWREIILIAILTASLAALALIAYERLTAPAYTASADVVVARLASEVTLDERIRTLVEDLGGNNGIISRRAALVELAKNGEIATAVIAQLGDVLSAEQREPSVLLGMIEVHVPTAQDGRTPSDLIRIKATANSPQQATQIANAWAVQYVDQINALYGQVPADVVASLQAELSDADIAYQSAQKELETFVVTSEIDTVQRQIDEQVALRDIIQSGRIDTLTSVTTQDRVARQRILNSLTSAQLDSLVQVFSQQVKARTDDLEQLYSARSAAQKYLDQARNLSTQVDAGGDAAAASNTLALQLLKTTVFAAHQSPVVSADGTTIVTGLPTDLVLSTELAEVASEEDQKQDIDALAGMLELYLDDLDQRIEEASETLLSGEGYAFLDEMNADALGISALLPETQAASDDQTIAGVMNAAIRERFNDLFKVGDIVKLSQSDVVLAEDSAQIQLMGEMDTSIQALRAELAAEQAQEQYLVQKRDLAWTTYDALSNKAAELHMELSAANSEVRIGAFSIPPSRPVAGPSLVGVTLLAFVFGLLLGVFVAFLANYLGYEPFTRRRLQTA